MIRSINSKKISTGLVCVYLLLLPVFASAVGKGTPAPTTVPSEAEAPKSALIYVCHDAAPGECNFGDLLKAVDKIMNWGTIFALQFSVVVIAYAGYLYMLSEGNPGKLKEANDMFTKVAIGIAWIIGAWLVVSLIMNSLGVETPITFK
jgi:hypothetical protein